MHWSTVKRSTLSNFFWRAGLTPMLSMISTEMCCSTQSSRIVKRRLSKGCWKQAQTLILSKVSMGLHFKPLPVEMALTALCVCFLYTAQIPIPLSPEHGGAHFKQQSPVNESLSYNFCLRTVRASHRGGSAAGTGVSSKLQLSLEMRPW